VAALIMAWRLRGTVMLDETGMVVFCHP
jgi:hypothetical protein